MNLAQLWRRVQGMVVRGKVASVNDGASVQTVTGTGRKGETLSDVERLQPYGLSSNPPAGSGLVCLRVGGNPDAPLILGDLDPNRPSGLASGAVRLYDDDGNYVNLSGGITIVANGPLQVSGTHVTIEANGIAGDVIIQPSATGGRVLVGDATAAIPVMVHPSGNPSTLLFVKS